jgi:hypothetical protein
MRLLQNPSGVFEREKSEYRRFHGFPRLSTIFHVFSTPASMRAFSFCAMMFAWRKPGQAEEKS